MNYLAHAYLSFGHPQILIGNMISDFVKGSAKNRYPNGIQKGIMLHRQIDTFTDNHPVIGRAKEIFRPAYRLYSAPIIDILLDHYLANDLKNFAAGELHTFTQKAYETIENNSAHLPLHFAQVFSYMKHENWLFNYSNNEGMRKSLRGLVRRATYLQESETAFQLFQSNYRHLQQCYSVFFPDVKRYAKQALEQLLD